MCRTTGVQHLLHTRRSASEGSLAHLLLDSAHALALVACPPVSGSVPVVQSLYGVYILQVVPDRPASGGMFNKVCNLHHCVTLVLSAQATRTRCRSSSSSFLDIQGALNRRRPGEPCMSSSWNGCRLRIRDRLLVHRTLRRCESRESLYFVQGLCFLYFAYPRDTSAQTTQGRPEAPRIVMWPHPSSRLPTISDIAAC